MTQTLLQMPGALGLYAKALATLGRKPGKNIRIPPLAVRIAAVQAVSRVASSALSFVDEHYDTISHALAQSWKSKGPRSSPSSEKPPPTASAQPLRTSGSEAGQSALRSSSTHSLSLA